MNIARSSTALLGCATAFLLAGPTAPRAVTREALVVGVGAYGNGKGVEAGGRKFKVLHGAPVDAREVATALERLEFKVTLLIDAQATRKAILDGLDALAGNAQPGDVRVFYFTGHGSRVRNSRSPERDQLDESILPVDVGSVKDGKEVKDIRDKELAAKLDALLDRKAIVTAIFDSCHAGSVTRGLPSDLPGGVAREAPWDLRDVNDPSRPAPPETRGALILSSSQDEQRSWERGPPFRGLFSKALAGVLARPGAAKLPARALFLLVEDDVRRTSGGRQVPVLAGSIQRQRATLFDAGEAQADSAAVVRVWRDASSRLVAESAPLLPLGVGTALEPDAGDRKLRLVVDRGDAGPNAVPLVNADPKTGLAGFPEGMYRIAEWKIPGDNMKVYVPIGMSDEQLAAAKAAVDRLRRARVPLVDDPVDDAPTHSLEAISTDGHLEWLLFGPCAKRNQRVRARDPVKLVQDALSGAGGARTCKDRPANAKVFVRLPPPRALADGLRSAWQREGAPANLAHAPGDAAYALTGRIAADGLSYAFVRGDKAPAAMPPRTDFVTTAASSGGVEAAKAQLRDVGERLARTFGWLGLAGAGPAAQAGFPYEIYLRPKGGGEPVGDGAAVKDGEAYDLVLRRTPGASGEIPRRHVYVFSYNSCGVREIVFPHPELGFVENRLPLAKDSTEATSAPAPEEIVLLGGENALQVGQPFGTDTLFLFAFDRTLFNAVSLQDEGVKTKGTSDERDAYAEDLLRAAATKGEPSAVPLQWSLRKMSFTASGSEPPKCPHSP